MNNSNFKIGNNTFIKKNSRVYYAQNVPFCLENTEVEKIKSMAKKDNVSMFRICMHDKDTDPIQEMLIMHLEPQFIGICRTKPFENQKCPRSMSFHFLEGEGRFNNYDKKGNIINTFLIDSNYENKKNLHLRVDSGTWRSIESFSKEFLFIEITAGPFNDSMTEWF